MSEFVRVETEEAVATIRLDRPVRRRAAEALRAAKQAIDEGLDVDLDTGLEIERLQFAGLFTTEDQRAGMRSFIENGPGKARFSGR